MAAGGSFGAIGHCEDRARGRVVPTVVPAGAATIRSARQSFLALAGTAAMFAGSTLAAMAQPSNALPEPLVYLADIAPTILQDMRYAGPDNFTGAPVPGYAAAECILRRETAAALARVQADLVSEGYALKVYDCYRPERAVRAFVVWAAGPETAARSSRSYHPSLPRSALFQQGYIARASSHSRGIAVDVTLVRLPPSAPVPVASGTAQPSGDCTAAQDQRTPDSSVDMGTSFDCFDSKSHTASSRLTEAQRSARRRLVDAMQRHGWRNYQREWWHFTHTAARGDESFDVPIRPRPLRAP
jgi:zinc D-Ala-D-Ala dipeptidase